MPSRQSGKTLPKELEPILMQILEQVSKGVESPSVKGEDLDLLHQRYIHHSANYNSTETQVAGMPAKLRVVFPHAPASSGERLVYPQKEGE